MHFFLLDENEELLWLKTPVRAWKPELDLERTYLLRGSNRGLSVTCKKSSVSARKHDTVIG